jgi:6-pyruvoyl-tetrahydropterin synthase
MALVTLKHNVEIAHRLLELPGKCENFHGHSLKVHMSLYGGISSRGLLIFDNGKELEFGEAKKIFRQYLDTEFDHRLHLNANDPWATLSALFFDETFVQPAEQEDLPGLRKFYSNGLPADPTTENIALHLVEWVSNTFETDANIDIHETDTNSVSVDWAYITPGMQELQDLATKWQGASKEVNDGTTSE